MDFIPAGPSGPHRPQQPTTSISEQGSVQQVPVGKQIPSGQPLERKPLDEWKIDSFSSTPIIAKPSSTVKPEYQGVDAKERVLAMLAQMEPDAGASLVHRVSSERQQEMAERIARIQNSLDKESVRKAFDSGALLLDLADKTPDITLNYVMALALKIQRAQDDIRAGINADPTNVRAWKDNLALFSQLQDAWHELHPIVTDLCTYDPLAFEMPKVPLKRSQSLVSEDSGVGDLIDLEDSDPWNQPQPLITPQPATLPPATEARISELERQLGDTIDHLRHERSMSDRLQESQEKVEALTLGNQQLVHQYSGLQKEVETLRKRPLKANRAVLQKAGQQLSSLANENSNLKKQLDHEKEKLRLNEEEFAQQAIIKDQLEADTKEFERKVLEARELHQKELDARDEAVKLLKNDVELKTANYEKEKQEVEKLQRALEEKQRELDKAEAQFKADKQILLTAHKKEISKKQEAFDELTERFERLQQTSEEERRNAYNKYESELKAKKESIQTLTAEKESLREQFQKTVPKEQLDNEKSRRIDAEEQFGNALSLVSSLPPKVEELQGELKEKTLLVSQLREEGAKLEDINRQLALDHQQKVKELERKHEETLKTKETERETSLEKEEEYKRELDALKLKLAESEQEKATYQEQLMIQSQGFEQERTELKSSISEFESKPQQLTQESVAEGEKQKLLFEKAKEELVAVHEKALALEQQKVEQFEQDRKLAVTEQGRLEKEFSELRTEKERVDSKIVELNRQLEKAEEEKAAASEAAAATEGQLKSSLSELTEERDQLDKEAREIKGKFQEAEEKLSQNRIAASEAQNTLRKSLSSLSDEKKVIETTVNGLKAKLARHEETLKQKAGDVERLELERTSLRAKVRKLETTLEVIKERKESSESAGVQTTPELEVQVQDFIDRIDTHSRSGATSGVYSDSSDTDLSDVDSVAMGTEILYRRPGATGKGKQFQLKSILENSLKNLRKMSSNDDSQATSVDIAFSQAIKGFESQQRALDAQLKSLEEAESTLGDLKEPPSHSPLRQAMIKRYELFIVELEALHEKFREHVKGSKDHDQRKAQKISEALEDHINKVNFSVGFQRRRDQEFHQYKDDYSKLPESEVKTPEGRVQDIHVSLQSLMKHRDQEVRDYVAGAYVKRAAAEILNDGVEAVKQAQGDKVREELVRFETCLRRLLPKALPLKMGSKLGPLGTKFIIDVVEGAVSDLKKEYTPHALDVDEANLVRGEAGVVLARKMVENPEIRPTVLSLLTSLQETHEGVATSTDYYSASVVGLKRIRDEFRLVDMPTMKELLDYAVHDLKSENSLLATEAQKRHRQTAVDKAGQLRKDKMLHLCNGYLKKETSPDPDAPEYSLVRGQSHVDGVMVVHPHREVLDCFKEGGQVFSADHTRSPRMKGRLQVRDLSGASGGLLNTFFEKAPGGATQVTNDKTNLQCIQISSSDTQPEDIVFKYNTRDKCWQVNLGNTLWNVDPAFNLDNPNLKIPFEAQEFGATHRDWIPLKSLGGEIAILALRKVPKNGRYFLYQKGHEDVLVPRVIGSSNPEKERMEAQFFYDAAMASTTKEDVSASAKPDVIHEVRSFMGAAPLWLSGELSGQQLQTLHDQAILKVFKKPVRCPIPVQDVTSRLDVMTLKDSPYREIQKKKQSKTAVASGSDIKPEHTGSKLAPYNQTLFGQFSVDANFEQVGEHYIEQCRKECRKECRKGLKGSDALLNEEIVDRGKFRREAFKELTVYKGCELKPDEVQDRTQIDRPMVEGTPEYSRQVLTKVISVNRDHQLRLVQGLNAQSDKLLRDIRENDQESKLSIYSDDELLDFMVLEFEQGKIPENMTPEAFVRQLTGIILSKNDLEQSARLASKLNGLMVDLEQLERDGELKARVPEYIQNCQQWNLNMALIATEQDAIARRLDSYTVTTLNSGTRAQMAFECRVRTVLRENQVKEVQEALEQITHAMTGKNGRMSRVSQLGTGWGKSTIVQPLTDHACAQNIGVNNRSVLVIAPESNQADLNITLGRYFAQKGLNYQVLDIENQYVNPANGKRWWTTDNLNQIYLTLLGLPPDTDAERLQTTVENPRAPVGVSVKNIQILMQLRNQLQHKEELNSENQASLQKLNMMADLIRESMVFFDEWDRTLMPSNAADLKEVADDINRVLKPLGVPDLKPDDIMQCHGQIVQGCKRKHMLSATVGSGYTAAVAAGVTEAEEIKEQCHTDVFTTQQRFWHWLNCATPVYVHFNQAEGRKKLYQRVMDEVGTNREIIVFDGNHKDGDSAEQAIKDYKLLSEAREQKGGKPRGVLYYDKQKKLHKYEKGDPVYGRKNGAPLPKEEEDFIRANRGRDVDVVLTHRESIGTDAPQGPESVGIYMGLLEQADDGRASMAAQQMGRMMRASGDLRKPQALYVAVNLDAMKQLPGSGNEKESFFSAYQKESGAMATLSEKFECDVDDLAPELKELVHTPLQVPLQDSEDMAELERLTESAMIDEVERLAGEEWVQHDLTFEQMEALKSFKQHQWRTKKAYLILTASELARREVSLHTQSCETALHKANVESHLEEIFANEHAWLKSGMGGQLSKFELSTSGFSNEQFRNIVQRRILKAVGDELSDLSRRTSTASGNLKAINDQISSGLMTQQITERLTRLKEDQNKVVASEGLGGSDGTLLNSGFNYVQTANQALVSESKKAFDEAIKRTDEVIHEFYATKVGSSQKIMPIGLEQIVALRDELDKKAGLVKKGQSAGIEEAKRSKQTIEHHYKELMRAVAWVGFDGLIINANDCDETFRRVCGLMKSVVDIPENRKAKAQNVGQPTWEKDEKFKTKEFADSLLKLRSFQESAGLYLKQQNKSAQNRVNVKGIHRLAWKEEVVPKQGAHSPEKVSYKSVRAPVTHTVKSTAISNHQSLDKAVQDANNAPQRQRRSEEVMLMRQKASENDIALFDVSMNEVIQKVLTWYEEYSKGVQEYSRQQQERMHQQSQLMQVPIVLAP